MRRTPSHTDESLKHPLDIHDWTSRAGQYDMGANIKQTKSWDGFGSSTMWRNGGVRPLDNSGDRVILRMPQLLLKYLLSSTRTGTG